MAETRVASLSEIPVGEMRGYEVEGAPVALANQDGTIHAFSNVCTHMSCSLDDGELVDGQVQCLCHGSVFDLTTGEPTELPATEPIRVYPVRVEADDVFVSLE